MLYKTMDVLQNIQDDVNTYLQKLSHIDKQIKLVSSEIEETPYFDELKDIHEYRNIDEEVDNLFKRIKEKQK
jgi:hypothetical protein